MPTDPWGAFAYLVSKYARGVARELVEQGKTMTEARNAVIHCFLNFAAGEACRIAREEGREPDLSRWQTAADTAFTRAVARTVATQAQEGEACQIR